MLTCTSLTVPKRVQSLAKRIGMVESSPWESVSGGGDVSLQAPECGSEVPSPAGECRQRMVGGGA